MLVCPECGVRLPEGTYCPHDGAALRDPGDDNLLGEQVGRFRVARLLGSGGMGRVYLGIQPDIGSRVAIKVLSRDCADNRELVERFFSEARAVNVIRHENIVNVIDLALLADGRPYIVMEYLDGEPLSAVIRRLGRLPLGSLGQLTHEVLSALIAAHRAGIVHRDLKPDNIFISPRGRAKVLDFGIAKLHADALSRSAPTRTGSLLGTPQYMAPEQALAHPVDARADVYAVGVILYECATGSLPIHGSSLYELLKNQIEQIPTPPRALRPDLPPAYESVIMRALAKNPAHRFASAHELATALQSAATTLDSSAWQPILGTASGCDDSANTGVPSPPYSRPSWAATDPEAAPRIETPHLAPPQRRPDTRSGFPLAAGIMLVALGIGAAGVLGWSAWRRLSSPPAVASTTPSQAATAVDDGASPDEGDDEPPAAASTTTPASVIVSPPEEPSRTPAAAVLAPERSPNNGASDAVPAISVASETDAASPQTQAPIAPKTEKTPDAQASDPVGKDDRFADFDVTGFIPRAEGMARRIYDDAILIRIDAQGVLPNGHANLTLDEDFSVLYRFSSPSRSKRPDDLPLGIDHKPDCKIYVNVAASGISVYPLKGWKCDEPLIGPPRCSAREVWKHGIEQGAPRKNAVAELGYWAGPGGRGRWHLDIDGAFSEWITDGC